VRKLTCDYQKFSQLEPCGKPPQCFYYAPDSTKKLYVRCKHHTISLWREHKVDEATFLVAEVMES
jgi:hypothetical protein